jgi:hypothetical protein
MVKFNVFSQQTLELFHQNPLKIHQIFHQPCFEIIKQKKQWKIPIENFFNIPTGVPNFSIVSSLNSAIGPFQFPFLFTVTGTLCKLKKLFTAS